MKFPVILAIILSALALPVSSFVVPTSRTVTTSVTTGTSKTLIHNDNSRAHHNHGQKTAMNLAPLAGMEDINSMLLAADEAAKTVKASGALSWKAAGGTSLISAILVGLLFAWNQMVKYFYLRQPRSFRPVQESIFATLAGWGVIGVSLDILLGTEELQKSLKGLSKDFFGKPDILVQNTEFIHDAFFQLALVFAVASGAMLLKGQKKLDDIATIQEEQVDPSTGIYTLRAENLAQYIKIREFNRPQEQPGYIGIQREIFMDRDEWSAKILLLKNHVEDLFPSLPADFRVEALMEESFAENMYKAVQVPFLAWAFFIPAIAFSNAVDLSHGVVNSGASNAAASAGYFFDSFISFVPAISTVIISSIWGYWNCWKMTQIKYMILPQLEPDVADGGRPIIRPPPMYNDYVRNNFDPSPPSLRRLERIWGKEPLTIYDDLFGQAGSAGLELFGNSIKYQSWLTLSNIVYFAYQILPRDFEVLVNGAKAGVPSMVGVELYAYAILTGFSIFSLVWVTPRTFWNYCVVSCMDGDNLVELLRLSGYGSPTQVAQPRVAGSAPPPVARRPPMGRQQGFPQGGNMRPRVGSYIQSEDDIM